MASNLVFEGIELTFNNEIKGNFVRLPLKIITILELSKKSVNEYGVFLKDRSGKLLTLVGWDGIPSQDNVSVEINPSLLSLGEAKNKTITVELEHFDESLSAKEVFVEPVTSDDWEIIEKNAVFFKDHILGQTRFVTMDNNFICYVNNDNNLFCNFKIKNIVFNGDSSGKARWARISEGVLIIVSPLENKSRSKTIKKNFKILQTVYLRAHFRNLEEQHSEKDICLINNRSLTSKYKVAKLSLVNIPLQKENQDENKVVFVDIKYSKNILPNHISLGPRIFDNLCLPIQNGYKLKVDFIDEDAWTFPLKQLDDLKVLAKITETKETSDLDINQIKSQFNESYSNSLISNDQTIAFINFVISFKLLDLVKRSSIPFIRLNNHFAKRIDFEVVKSDKSSRTFSKHEAVDIFDSKDVLNEGLITELLGKVSFPILPSNCMLIEGSSGMGKTTLMNKLKSRIKLESYHYVHYVDCNNILSQVDGFKLDDLSTLLDKCIDTAYWYLPSILILDNIEFWLPNKETDNPQGNQNNKTSLSYKLSVQLIEKINNISLKNPSAVRVILTSESRNFVNKILFEKHFISKVWSLKPPDNNKRVDLIRSLCNTYVNEKIEFENDNELLDLSIKIDGYSPLDVKILMDRIYYQLQIKNNDLSSEKNYKPNVVTKSIVDKALDGFTSFSLRNVNLTKNTGVNWKDIGALFDAKRILLETLEWPTKYSKIFEKSPLRLRSGILLYGYAGCGKTLLASAVAQQCGLNFISIKGPEILNKYIGASEQSVRELFEKAQSVKPCILFFDEFDSIAPKRGHDSTGVTDRIVNQFLTQMDGAEGLDGVYVLAATSRPDLIDSALLRPGRLDKSIICNLPNELDRCDILKAITSKDSSSKKLKIQQDVDLNYIASMTEGFSGADLQGLCYNAYIKSVHNYLKKQQFNGDSQGKSKVDLKEIQLLLVNEGSGTDINQLKNLRGKLKEYLNAGDNFKTKTNSKQPENTFKTLSISLTDFVEALKDTKASISEQEYKKLNSIYKKFAKDREGKMPSGEGSRDVGTRSSLM